MSDSRSRGRASAAIHVGDVPAGTSLPAWYPELLDSVSAHISQGHRLAVRAANAELLFTYWSIGREILDRQDQEGYGTKVVDRLSGDLNQRFPDARGYSPRNLKYMRAFAAAWPDFEVVQRSVAQLPWRHQIALLEKLPTPDLREWYAAAAVENGWSRDLLAFHIETGFNQRVGKAITNFAATLPPERSDLAQQATRDPYLFDFLSTTDTRLERDLEQGLIDHVSRFLLELGQGFAFVGRQIRLELGGEEFFCDLLFYHLRLRCYVVIELKAVKFDPAFLGRLGMYMAAVDDLLTHTDDHPTIGLADLQIQEQRGGRVRPARRDLTHRRRPVDRCDHNVSAGGVELDATQHRGAGVRAGRDPQ